MNNILFNIDEIVSVCHASVLQQSSESVFVSDILTDSRHATPGSNSLFVALKGGKHNGHQYIEEAYSKGIKAFLISEDSIAISANDIVVLKVSDTMLALQQLAASHRLKFKIPTLAITGSNGKTVVKEWLFQLLSPDFSIIRSPKSYNSQVGVPLSVCKLRSEHQMAIFEAGISQTGEMIKLEKVIQPTAGIFTNIGTAHDENFINHSQKTAEKLQLFVNCKKLVYCSDYYDIAEKLISSGLNKKIELFSWGSKEGSLLQIKKSESTENSTVISAIYNGKHISVTIPFIDKASIENATHCWAFMLMEGYDNNVVDQRIQKLNSIEMRLEVKEGINGCTIINDSYNSDINSLSIAIDFLEKNKEYRQKTLVLSDILQSGKQNETLVKEIASLIERRGIDRFIGIGPVLAANKKYFSDEASFYANTDSFLREYDLVNFRNEMILLKGARQFGFERIGALLEAKAHETILSTDLNALTHNINFFKSKLPSKTRMMAMVKAFAYGSGSIEIARHLEYHRLDYLAVAYTDEGVTLRKAGITTPIMVMSPEDSNHYFLFRYNLEPEIFSLSSLQKLIVSAKEFEEIIELPIKIHIKFDSGMHRLGFAETDIEGLADLLVENKKYIQVASAFSHFSASDETKHNLFTLEQLDSFNLMANKLEQKIGGNFIRHIANSAGALRFPDAHLDMVRIGIGLYGIDPSGNFSHELKPVVSLKTKVLQIKKIAPGQSIGYSRKAISENTRTTATLAIGYADGLHRVMGNGNWKVCINGHLVPLIGNICMDMCMADITGIDNISEGDEVEIFGTNCLLQDYANAMGTIAYEALTSVSSRVKRVYIQQD